MLALANTVNEIIIYFLSQSYFSFGRSLEGSGVAIHLGAFWEMTQ